jgi:DNA-binding transcriptional LysR family regulator
MSIALFKTLIAVSETGSFRGAAEVVCVTHAAVGQQMKRLEESFGVSLFDRTEKIPRLNQLGKALVPKAKALVHAYETILDDLTGDPGMIGELVLGAVPSAIRGLIPKSAKRLVSLYPDLHIRVVPGLSPDLLEQIEQGSLDAAVISEPASLHDNLNWMPFFEERLVLLTAPEVTETDPLKILETMPYIRHTRRASTSVIGEKWLARNKIRVNGAMEMGSLENLTSMVAHNLGVAVVPDICVPDPIFSRLNRISLGEGAPSRILGLVTRADCSKFLLVQALADQIDIVIEDHKADGRT